MDGLTSAVILKREGILDRGIELVHPQDIIDRRIEVTADDVLVNVPYHPDCGLWFDHHPHTASYPEPPAGFHGARREAPSASRVVFEHYGGASEMPDLAVVVSETDRIASAQLSQDDVLEPADWTLLAFTIDARTGIGAFEDYFFTLFDLLTTGRSVDEILAHPAVERRCRAMREADAEFRAALQTASRMDGPIVVTDLRPWERAPIGNRFLVYALFPDATVSVRLHWGPQQEFVVVALGHSVLNRGCTADLGELAARYGGGGRYGAASIPLPPDVVDDTLPVILAELRGRC
jgi:hypothetical protein